MTVKRLVTEGTVEERILTVRRALLVDRPLASTGICATSTLESDKPVASRAKKSSIEMLEKVIGTIEVNLA